MLIWIVFNDSLLSLLCRPAADHQPPVEHGAAAFADDVTALASEVTLASQVKTIEQWTDYFDVKVNVGKSALIQIVRTDMPADPFPSK